MAQCDYCGKEIQTLSTFTCSYCGKTFCPEHRLPFNHNCTHIEAWKQTPPPGQKKAQQKAARNPISTSALSSSYSPWVIIAGIVVLILIGIVTGMYVL
ncbi:MAG: zinc finger AN1 domain-containing stress-associated protein [Euryarchaeota archaeon]|nr:zinc finger AN1 domain-containing stress-associated protein [Euryarchaeota archaeon]